MKDVNLDLKVKVKWFRYRSGVAQRVGRGIALLFHDRGTWRWWVVSSMPRPHFTPRKTRYPFYRRLGGSQGRSGRLKNLVPTGIRYPTVQPVVSRYTDWATWPTNLDVQLINKFARKNSFTCKKLSFKFPTKREIKWGFMKPKWTIFVPGGRAF
jgi:hypothetical protein